MATMNTSRKAKPSSADIAAAARLKKLWDAAVRMRRGTDNELSQDTMATVLANATGKGTQGLVSQYLNGKIPLNFRALLLFTKEIGCDPGQVRTDLPELKAGRPLVTNDEDWADILGVRQAAALGDGAEPDEWAETHMLKFRSDSLSRKHLHADKLAVIYGKGDSMYPTIKDGDAILVDTADKIPKSEKLFVITHGRDLFAKRLVELGGRWFIDSDNKTDPKWKRPIPVDEAKGFEIHGRVRWIGSWED